MTPPTSAAPVPGDRLDVVVAAGALPDADDADAARDVLRRALAAHGLRGDLVLTATADELAGAVGRLPDGGGPVVLPPGADDVAALGLPGDAPLLRVDLLDRPHDRSPRVRRHVRGRGVDGLRYAVDAWWFLRTSPGAVHAYGPHPDQHAELRLPARTPPPGGFPVAVLVHGGYWRSRWQADLMDAVAVDLTGRGLATWNVEYRRPDDHDWTATTADVAAAVLALADADAPLDLARVVALGHSAGGQLVARLAADLAGDLAGGPAAEPSADPSAVVRPVPTVRPVLTVSLAGVLDLVEGERRGLGGGAVPAALGGRAADLPEVYRASSPRHRLPIGLPLAVVLAGGDDPDLLEIGRSFTSAARERGDDVVVVEGEGDHFAVIDPASTVWRSVADLVASRVGC